MKKSDVQWVNAALLVTLGSAGCYGTVLVPGGAVEEPGGPSPDRPGALAVREESVTSSYSGFFSVSLDCRDGQMVEVSAPNLEPLKAGEAMSGLCSGGRFRASFVLPVGVEGAPAVFTQPADGSRLTLDLRRRSLPSNSAAVFHGEFHSQCMGCHLPGTSGPNWGTLDTPADLLEFIYSDSDGRFPAVTASPAPRDLRTAPGSFLRRLAHDLGGDVSPIYEELAEAGTMPPVGTQERAAVEADFAFFDLTYAFLAELPANPATPMEDPCLVQVEPIEPRPVTRLTNEELHVTMQDLFGLSPTFGRTASNPLPGVTADISTYINGLSFPALPPNTPDAIFESLLSYTDEVVAAFDVGRYNQTYAAAVGCSLAAGSSDACLRSHVETVLTRAFRGEPVPGDAIDFVVSVYGEFRQELDVVPAFAQATVKYVALNPYFIFKSYRGDGAEQNGVRALTNGELANRVSFLFWGTGATAELLAEDWDRLLRSNSAQAAGDLEQVLLSLVADPRADHFFRSFGFQWLHVNTDLSSVLDMSLLPQASDLQVAFDGELVSMLRHLVQNRRPLDELITADYTFLNRTLAEWYGVDPSGFDASFRRVNYADYPQLYNRRGVLTQAKLLSSGSMPSRPSASNRGTRVLRHIICSEMGNPSGFVLEQDGNMDLENVTEVERFRNLTEDPATSCAGCHVRINPVGYPFHAFDRLGQHNMATAQNGSLPEPEVYENVVVRGTPTSNPSPIWKAQLNYLDDRGGRLEGLPTLDTPITGSFDDHLGLINLMAQNKAVEACVVENLYDYTAGFKSSDTLNRDQATIEAHGCAKSDLVQDAPDFLSLLVAMVSRPGFTQVKRD